MTKQILKIITLVGFVSLAVGLTGCQNVGILSSITTPQQQLPRPSDSPQTSDCKMVFYTWTIFRTNFDGTIGIPVFSPNNYITAYANGQIVPTSKYFVALRNVATGASRCVTINASGQMYFSAATNERDMFNVCFNDKTYSSQPAVSLVISSSP